MGFKRQDKSWHSGFAVNTAPIESRLEKVPFDEIKGSIAAGSVEQAEAASFAERGVEQAGSARELTPYLALLALALLAAECFLANRFYGREGAPAPEPEPTAPHEQT